MRPPGQLRADHRIADSSTRDPGYSLPIQVRKRAQQERAQCLRRKIPLPIHSPTKHESSVDADLVMDRTGVVLLALVPVIVTCGPLSCVIFAKIRRHRKSHPGLRQLANARNQLTAVGGCSNSLGAERLAGSGWGTLGDRSTTTASDIGVGVGVGVGADGVLVESRTPQEANSSCPICLGHGQAEDWMAGNIYSTLLGGWKKV
ncbi:hypothetical protein HYQ44_010525 [Verticillium longisporum]|nr:hypothetical protein HYQ44_010525 [Verticillium longisporum]